MNRKDLRNYIHNDLGISKDEIRNMLNDEIKKVISEETTKVLNDKEKISSMIEKEIIRQLKYNTGTRTHYLISTMDEIYNKIDSIIHDEVRKRLVIELKEPDEE